MFVDLLEQQDLLLITELIHYLSHLSLLIIKLNEASLI